MYRRPNRWKIFKAEAKEYASKGAQVFLIAALLVLAVSVALALVRRVLN